MDAASYPLVFPEEYDATATIGQVYVFKYTYFPAFENEQIYVEIFDPDGRKIGDATQDFYNYSVGSRYYNLSWDTADHEPGRYKLVATNRFYSMYEWHEAPSTTVHYITLVEPGKCPHKYKTTTTKATLTKNGKTVNKCTVCSKVKSSSTINKISSIKLSPAQNIQVPKLFVSAFCRQNQRI